MIPRPKVVPRLLEIKKACRNRVPLFARVPLWLLRRSSCRASRCCAGDVTEIAGISAPTITHDTLRISHITHSPSLAPSRSRSRFRSLLFYGHLWPLPFSTGKCGGFTEPTAWKHSWGPAQARSIHRIWAMPSLVSLDRLKTSYLDAMLLLGSFWVGWMEVLPGTVSLLNPQIGWCLHTTYQESGQSKSKTRKMDGQFFVLISLFYLCGCPRLNPRKLYCDVRKWGCTNHGAGRALVRENLKEHGKIAGVLWRLDPVAFHVIGWKTWLSPLQVQFFWLFLMIQINIINPNKLLNDVEWPSVSS